MKVKYVIGGVAIVGLIGILALVADASANTIYVPDDQLSIQDAIDSAGAGDTIIVRDGIYYENVYVNKRLTIQSENGSTNCIVNASGSYDYAFAVDVDYANISGFTIENATEGGVYLWFANGCNILCNNFSHNYYGIYMHYSNGTNITGNTISNNNYGIKCYYMNASYIYPYNIEIHYNNIVGNTIYGVCSDVSVDSEYNYWGNETGPYHATLNPSGTGDNVSYNVDFTPWLGAYIKEEHTDELTPGTNIIESTDETDTIVEVDIATSTTITVVAYGNVNPADDDLPGGIKGVGTYIDVIIEDEGAVIFPVNISIYYTQYDLDSLGITEQQIDGMYYWNETAGMWQPYTTWGVNFTDVILGGTAYQGHVWALAENPDQLSPKVIGAYSPQDALESIKDMIDDLAIRTVFKKILKTPLNLAHRYLNCADRLRENGRDELANIMENAAIIKLEVFQRIVNCMRERILTEDEADILISQAENVIIKLQL